MVRPLNVTNATVRQAAATPTQPSRTQPGRPVSRIRVSVNSASNAQGELGGGHAEQPAAGLPRPEPHPRHTHDCLLMTGRS